MVELDAEDRWILASLRSPERTGLGAWLFREAGILVPCAVIFWFAAVWGDVAALLLGPALYVGYRVYFSYRAMVRDRRLGEIVTQLEEERQHWAGVALLREEDDEEEEFDSFQDVEDAILSESPRDAVAFCFERASDETGSASAHYRTAAKHFRAGKVPRGSAHAIAALGHLQEARREARTATAIHTYHAETE